jgi:hypothetical protein
MVIRWAFGHHGSVDSFVEVPDADLGLVWAGLEGLLGSRSGTRPPASSFRRRRSAPPGLEAGPEWVVAHFDGLTGRDGERWWEFLAVGSFHGGLVSNAGGRRPDA